MDRLDTVSQEAQFDSLSLGVKLYNYFDGFKRDEVQLFSYFSSVLFPYTEEPLSEWKYQYTLNDETFYPFSGELNNSIDLHLLNGNFEEKSGFFIVTSRGISVFDDIKSLEFFKKREIAINAACITSVLVSYRDAENALLNDPAIQQKRKTLSNKEWINQDYIYPRIAEISKELGVPLTNITASSVSWIKYLNLINQEPLNHE